MSYRIHYPSLKKLSELSYVDPRVNTEGKRIFAEKEGNFRLGESNIHGHYVVYEDMEFPGSYIGVHIGSDLSEDTGEAPIHVVAIDPSRSAVLNRVAYRARASKIAESDDGLNESLNLAERMGMLTEINRPVRFRELSIGDKFMFEGDDNTMVKISATHYKMGNKRCRMDNKSEKVIKP